MKTSVQGRKAIEDFEGVRLKAYLDGGGIPTLGVGHVLGVKLGDICTWAQADQWLTEDLAVAEKAVNQHVTVPLDQQQFDALVSFVFNEGSGHFASSTLLKLLNDADYQGAANQFLAWDKIGGKDSPGLLNRRTAERALFISV